MTRDEIVARAIELDDPHGDDRCPGCGRFIAGWESYWAHYRNGFIYPSWLPAQRRTRNSAPLPWFPDAGHCTDDACPWDRDMLTARAFRRKLIRQAQNEVAA